MKQAVMIKPGEIKIHEVKEPEISAGEILIKIKRIGVCGTDIHVKHGLHPFTSYPVVQGHEYSATVEAVGEGVTSVKIGDLVTARPQLVCGECAPCKRGDYNICDNLKVQGFQAPGCAQDLFVVPEDRIISLPGITEEQGALVEPTAVGAHSTSFAPELKGKNVVVFGAGTIGNLVAQSVKCRGAKKVLITDVSQFRLDKALECGIDATCNVKEEKLSDAVQKAFGEEGFDVAFEAAGNESALDNAVQNIEKGGSIIVLGVFVDKPRIDMSVVGDRELKLIGTLMYKHEDYQEAAEWIASGKIKTEPIITKHFPFEQYSDAYEFIDKAGDKTLKVMIDVN